VMNLAKRPRDLVQSGYQIRQDMSVGLVGWVMNRIEPLILFIPGRLGG